MVPHVVRHLSDFPGALPLLSTSISTVKVSLGLLFLWPVNDLHSSLSGDAICSQCFPSSSLWLNPQLQLQLLPPDMYFQTMAAILSIAVP